MAYVRHWSYLVKVNDDNTETETCIAETVYHDWSSNWLGFYNSWNPSVENYPISAGRYYLKIHATDLNSNLFTTSMAACAYIDIEKSSYFTPQANFKAEKLIGNIGNNIRFTNNSKGDIISHNWEFIGKDTLFNSEEKEPLVLFLKEGKYDVKLTVTDKSGQSSTLFVEKYIEIGPDYRYAPNSYIFDINKSEYGGLYIPVRKAYAMWGGSQYLTKDIPNEKLSASLYWEDVSGLVKTVEIEQAPNPSDSKIKIMLDKSKGKGNAMIAFHVGSKGDSSDPVYWSWHLWVTDDPSDGVEYSTGFDFDLDGNKFVPKFMDRNLGATNNSFLGNDWHKSGGLMYQWGRKDAFPPLVYKDFSHYTVSGSFGSKPIGISEFNNTRHIFRPYPNIEDNIAYSVHNPFVYIKRPNVSIQENWFSDKSFISTNKNFDLWGDRNEGGLGGKWVNEPYKLKSSFDPCPCGWRVPSFEGNSHMNSVGSPWGKKRGTQNGVDTIGVYNGHSTWNGLKIYRELGLDFTNVSDRNIGVYPLTGRSYYYSGSVTYQDETSETFLWTSTATGGGQNGRVLHLITNGPPAEREHKFIVASHGSADIAQQNAVRCIEDPNISKIGDFPTEYIAAVDREYTIGLDNPNSYIVKEGQTVLKIPVNKAYSVYNQYLSDHGWLTGKLSANVHWTTNMNLVKSLRVIGQDENANIEVTLNPGQIGNAVVSLHIGALGCSKDTVAWSWLVWAPNGDPEQNTVTYITEPILPTNEMIVNLTKSGHPPLKTTFMDRSLGAIYALPQGLADNPSLVSNYKTQIQFSGGLHYQWGRKDPIPVFRNVGWGSNFHDIYLGSIDLNGKTSYTTLNYFYYSDTAGPNYTKEYAQYSNEAGVLSTDKVHESVQKILKYSVQNPLFYLWNNNPQITDWLSTESNIGADRWGHASKKSVFDPCPCGWRVPDQLFAYSSRDNNGDFGGTSPWYNGYYNNNQGIIQGETAYDLKKDYNAIELNNGTYIVGWAFDRSPYRIGNYSINLVRGRLGGRGNMLAPFNSRITGAWSATMGSRGQGLATEIVGNQIRTAVHRNTQIGMDVRCVKDEPRYTGEPIVSNTVKSIDTIDSKDMVLSESLSVINISPNPNSGLFKVLLTDITYGTIEVLDMNGILVFSKQFKGENEVSIDIQSSPAGVYVVYILSDKNVIKKIIKR